MGGKEILKNDNYPEELKHFLLAERQWISNHIKKEDKYTALFEIGCGEARNLDIAQEHEINYYGIDFDNDYIIKAKNKIKQLPLSIKAIVRCLSVFDLNESATPVGKNERVLCIFPFNALGNMGNLLEILNKVHELGYDVLISTYKIDEFSSQIREQYFVNCGYKNLRKEHTKHGLTFYSDEGLKSTAMNSAYVQSVAEMTNYSMLVNDFSRIGVMYSLSHPFLTKRYLPWASYFTIKKGKTTSLNLEDQNISGKTLLSLTNLITADDLTLDCLLLSYNKKISIEDLLTFLSQHKNIAHLYLVDMDFSDDKLSQLSQAWASPNVLETLDLFGNYLHSQGVIALASKFEYFPALTTLRLGKNNIGDEGLIAISEAFPKSRLLSLNVSASGITDKGVMALAEALKRESSIQKIDMSQNLISDTGANALIEVLEEYNHTLTDLVLNHTDISEALLKKINSLLETNKQFIGIKNPIEKTNYLFQQKGISPSVPSLLQVGLFSVAKTMKPMTPGEEKAFSTKMPTTLYTMLKKM